MLTEGTDYTVEWTNNTTPGTATGTVKGIGDYQYATDKTVTFTITNRKSTVKAANQTVLVGGSIDTSTSKASLSNPASGQSIGSVTLTGTDTSAVTTSGTITPSNAKIVDASGADVTGYYDLTYAAGTLTVKNGYTVTYDANGGTGSIDPQETDNTGAVTLSDGSAFEWARHTFTGWNTDASGTGTAYDAGAQVTLTGDTTLYAQWERNPVEGTVKATVAKGSWGNARLTTPANRLADAIAFTDEEAEAIEDGAIAFVYVRASEASPSSSLKAQLAASPGSGYTLGASVDITLHVRIGSGEARQVTETNEPLRVALDLPSELMADGRTFAVAREHDGNVSTIDSSLDGSTLTLSSDRFSTFGIDYADSKSSAQGSTPATGDPLVTMPLALVALFDIALIAYAVSQLRMIRRAKAEQR